MLVRLMYASRAAAGVDAEALATILRQSKARNPGIGVTGVLCFSDGLFLQLLEGGRPAVSQLYNRIAADPRHTDVELLGFEEIGERSFAGWSMGLANMARLNPGVLLKYGEKPVLNPFGLSGRSAMALLLELMATASIDSEP
jgi:hypothetical protein